jgi:hypothetical protein
MNYKLSRRSFMKTISAISASLALPWVPTRLMDNKNQPAIIQIDTIRQVRFEYLPDYPISKLKKEFIIPAMASLNKDAKKLIRRGMVLTTNPNDPITRVEYSIEHAAMYGLIEYRFGRATA